jgi:hypothetical protein
VQELIAYRDTNGHCRVPAVYKPNENLGWWVSKVRTQCIWNGQGKKTLLTDAHISELDNLGFVWNPNDAWKKRVQELTAYRDTNGHCRIPFLYKPNKALGNWVNKVRTRYTTGGQGKKTALTDAQISELDGLGFVWQVGGDELWKKRVEELIEYRNTNGHCQVPVHYKQNTALGWWVSRVRTNYKWRRQGKKTPLTDALISELDSLGFVWKAGPKPKEGLAADELRKKGVQDISGLSASQVPSNSIDQDAAPPNRTISPPPVPLQGARRNLLLPSRIVMI